MLGYFVMFLCGIVKILLCDYDVYIIDWCNVCDVVLEYGCFGLDEYVFYVIGFFVELGFGVYLLVVC